MEIKYRQKDTVKTMARLDTKYAELQSKLNSPGAGGREGGGRGMQCPPVERLVITLPFSLSPFSSPLSLALFLSSSLPPHFPFLTLSPPLRALIIRTEGGRATAKVEGGTSLNHLPPGKAELLQLHTASFGPLTSLLSPSL